MRLGELQRRFQAAILEPSTPAAQLDLPLTNPLRLRIHHAQFWTRMYEFICNWQPLLARYLGTVEMEEVIRRYVVARPPHTVFASEVCAQLAEFLRTTAPWSAWPIVAEIAAVDYRRALIRTNAEEATVTRAKLAAVAPAALAQIRFRLKKRSALIETRFRLEVSRLHLVERTTPIDAQLTYRLVHLTDRRFASVELDARTFRALERLVEGLTMADLRDHLTQLGFDDGEQTRFVDYLVDGDVLVAIAE